MPTLQDWQIQFFQVGTILLLCPLVTGAIARGEAIVQMRRGPRVLQPYYDIGKLFRKETVLPGDAGPVFRVAPYLAFAAYATVPLLIPVLTTFPLPLGYMGDILGGGFVLALASAHDHGFDLIVAGRHRGGGVGRFILHGVEERLASDAEIPVLVVGEPDGA